MELTGAAIEMVCLILVSLLTGGAGVRGYQAVRDRKHGNGILTRVMHEHICDRNLRPIQNDVKRIERYVVAIMRHNNVPIPAPPDRNDE